MRHCLHMGALREREVEISVHYTEPNYMYIRTIYTPLPLPECTSPILPSSNCSVLVTVACEDRGHA